MNGETETTRNDDNGTNEWYVYLLLCDDDKIYTGITNDLKKRMSLHKRGIGARFTRSFPPMQLQAAWVCPDRSTASSIENKIKSMDKDAKMQIISQWNRDESLYGFHPYYLTDIFSEEFFK